MMITNEELTQAILKLREAQAQTDEQMKKTDEQMKKTDEQIQETSRKVAALTQNIDGVNRSIGLEAEEFFYSSLKKNPTIANINFDYIYQNSKRDFKGETQEIDILLENSSSVGVVEVKNRVSQKSIDQLDKIMERFDYFHPLYRDYRVIGALAGKIFPKHLQEQALKKGYSVITQQGDHIEQINPI
ncbi:MAG: hypothetical protein U9R27_08975 [Campylobacterota bacterium]|nr:hypothetical protein [Campylobacterota bacterium]